MSNGAKMTMSVSGNGRNVRGRIDTPGVGLRSDFACAQMLSQLCNADYSGEMLLVSYTAFTYHSCDSDVTQNKEVVQLSFVPKVKLLAKNPIGSPVMVKFPHSECKTGQIQILGGMHWC